MNKLTVRQATILLAIALIVTKVQRFPTIITQLFGRNGWIFLTIALSVELILILIVLLISKLLKGKTVLQGLIERIGKYPAYFLAILFAVYFFFKLTIPFKETHEFFTRSIFDSLEWKWHSLMFLFLIVFLASGKFSRIGRTAEFFFLFIVIGFIGLLFLSYKAANLESLLPIEMPAFSSFISGWKHLSLWISDFLILLFFIGRVEHKNFKKSMFFSFVTSGILTIIFCVIFYGIFQHLATFQTTAVSTITEHSLLAFDLGRIDWILALFTISGAMITAGLFAYIAAEDLHIMTKIPKMYIVLFIALMLFIADNYLLSSISEYFNFINGYVTWLALFAQFILPILLILIMLIFKPKQKFQKDIPLQKGKKNILNQNKPAKAKKEKETKSPKAEVKS